MDPETALFIFLSVVYLVIGAMLFFCFFIKDKSSRIESLAGFIITSLLWPIVLFVVCVSYLFGFFDDLIT